MDTIVYDEKYFRRLNVSDAERMTQMYRSVEITRENYRDKFSDSADSFEKCGGMFLVNDFQKNVEILSSENEIIIGASDGEKITGMIWYELSCREYPYDDIRYFPGCERYRDIISEAVKNRTIFPGKEIIVMPGAGRGTACRLFLRLLYDAKNASMLYKCGEVYRVDGYEDEDGYHECDLLNIPSFKVLKKTGAYHIGTLPQRVIQKDSLKFYITPQFFLWDIEKSICTVEKITESRRDASL